ADREARRKARYRGNPERARFRRDQSASDEFVIRVSDNYAHRDAQSRSSALVHSMRRISLSHASTSPEPEAAQIQSENMHDGSNSRKAHSELLLPKPAIRVSSSLNAVTLMQQKAADDASEVFRIAQPDESAADDADCAPMDKDGGAA
ncbi:hypothetical protein LPJ56_006204, partial [Coemansia sp. RSA 2599]